MNKQDLFTPETLNAAAMNFVAAHDHEKFRASVDQVKAICDMTLEQAYEHLRQYGVRSGLMLGASSPIGSNEAFAKAGVWHGEVMLSGAKRDVTLTAPAVSKSSIPAQYAQRDAAGNQVIRAGFSYSWR